MQEGLGNHNRSEGDGASKPPIQLPRIVPESPEQRISALDILKKSFEAFARGNGCWPIGRDDSAALDQIGSLFLELRPELKSFVARGAAAPQTVGFPLSVKLLDSRASGRGTALALFECSDGLEFVLPDVRAESDNRPTRQFERLSSPVLLVGRAHRGPPEALSFTPIFSPEAFSELVDHARIVSGYLKSPMKQGLSAAQDIEVPSFLFSKIMEEVAMDLDLRGSLEQATLLLSDIRAFRVISAGEFEVDVLVDRYALEHDKESRFLGSRVETHTVKAALVEAGLLRTDHVRAVKEGEGQDRQRKAA